MKYRSDFVTNSSSSSFIASISIETKDGNLICFDGNGGTPESRRIDLLEYDAIITAGTAIRKGQAGTLGEIEAKPHPWLYAETAMALGVSDKSKIVGIEDSAAGVMSIRLAGFAALGVAGGNLAPSGMLPFLYNRKENESLMSLIPMILGK